MNKEELKVEIWERLQDKIRWNNDDFGDLITEEHDYNEVCWMIDQFSICWNGGDLKEKKIQGAYKNIDEMEKALTLQNEENKMRGKTKDSGGVE